jgi:long-chain fatty acid transport protein
MFAYDSSPFDHAENRTPDLPLDRQIRYATGFQYDWNDDVTVGFAYTFLDAGNAKIDKTGGPLTGSLQGDYDKNYINIFNINVIWKF